jgi:hypothetical protein
MVGVVHGLVLADTLGLLFGSILVDELRTAGRRLRHCVELMPPSSPMIFMLISNHTS